MSRQGDGDLGGVFGVGTILGKMSYLTRYTMGKRRRGSILQVSQSLLLLRKQIRQ